MFFLCDVTSVKIYYYIGNNSREFFPFRMGFGTRGVTGEIGHKTKTELDTNLRLFYADARKEDEVNYSRSTLLGFRNGLERYLNNTPYKKGIHIDTDPAFQQSNLMLDAKLKYMKKQGEQNVKQKPAIAREDLRCLKESTVISPTTPQGLLKVTSHLRGWPSGKKIVLRWFQ